MPQIGAPSKGPNPYGKITTAKTKDEILEKFSKDTNGTRFVDREKHNRMGKNEFLKLMTHQLKNQDPLNPMDQNKFSADLAQFAQLEQLTNLNTKMSGFAPGQELNGKLAMAGLLGQRVTTQGTSIEYKGRPTSLNFYVEKPLKQAIVKILDGRGGQIAQIEQEKLGLGNQEILWDGNQFDGRPAKEGRYTFEVRAFDENGEMVKVKTQSRGMVKAIAMGEQGPELTLDNGKKVGLNDIVKFEYNSKSGATKPVQKSPSANKLVNPLNYGGKK